jgi:hypothetical protein
LLLDLNNIQVETGLICAPPTLGGNGSGLSGTRYLSLVAPAASENRCGGVHSGGKLCWNCDRPPCNICDNGTHATVTSAELFKLAMQTMAHETVPLSALIPGAAPSSHVYR